MSDLFASGLHVDPSVALAPPQQVVPMRLGPLPKVQFVIELVGPRSTAAAYARHLLQPNWYDALGRPDLWCMAPSDEAWQKLTDSDQGSYDSLALTWPLVRHGTALNGTGARNLLKRAEEFASHIQRRAMPMPVPEEVDRQAAAIQKLGDDLDIGFSIAFVPTNGSVAERDLWVQCSRLGLAFSPQGSFDWQAGENPLPLLSVTPIGETETFSLGAVQAGAVHDGVTIGFSIPLCPSSYEALSGCFHVGQTLCDALGGLLVDEEGNAVATGSVQRYQTEMDQARRLFTAAAIEPGSAEALAIWG